MEDMCHLVMEEERLQGKQHKASCRSKLVNSVSKPLHTLHMDMFGPTSVSSLNHKCKDHLANAELLVTFWAKALNTACYVQNKVLVIKPYNKTPYELFNERFPTIRFLRPFGCHVMILNTLDHLGKFDANGDKENRCIEKGTGPDLLFNIDTLTNSMNYVPAVVVGKSSTNISVETKVSTVSKPVLTGSLSVPLVTSCVPGIISRGGSSYPEPLSLGNAMPFKNRLEDFFGDIFDAVSLNDVEADKQHGDCYLIKTPMDRENPWGKDGTGKDMELHLYRSMIGSLMYLTASRPYIMFVICACARHQVTPKECHLHAVKRIFRYLKGHPKLGLWYPKESPFDLVVYSDSDFGGANQDRKSTTRGCQFLGRRLIS
nr:uncharacterized mitochondrial protein AtMg00810-like [Tanacetum cinerariifolium]